MSLVIEETYLPATLTAPPMTDEEFVEFCARFPDYFIETSAEGEILIMPPSDFLTSEQIGEIFGQLRDWSRANNRGRLSESSGGFVLPNGARRAPDFVVELRSPDDRLSRLCPKMREWVDNGASLRLAGRSRAARCGNLQAGTRA